ncbi:MAG: hypothetical protein AB7Q42_06375 [Acidimicrobiia bacterium]
MSSLWTPDGERPVGNGPDAPDGVQADDEVDGPTISEDEVRRIEQELAETRKRLAEVPAQVVVLNHAMGLYELAAIHLSATPPNLTEAALAVDAFACIVEGLGERLGADATTLRDALSQIRLAFVQIKGASAEH